MTKEELEAKVAKQLSIINDANDKICSCVNDYIESLPYKVGDKVSCSRCDVCWITSIVPKRYYSGFIMMLKAATGVVEHFLLKISSV